VSGKWGVGGRGVGFRERKGVQFCTIGGEGRLEPGGYLGLTKKKGRDRTITPLNQRGHVRGNGNELKQGGGTRKFLTTNPEEGGHAIPNGEGE